MVAEEIKKSRTCKHGTHKIKGHKSTKYKDLQRFKTQRTQTQTQPSISSKPRTSHEKSNQTLHTNIKPRNKPINFKPKFEKPVNKPRNFKPTDLIETH